MATQITQRAHIVCSGLIAQNGVRYTVWQDSQVGQRVNQDYGTRTWLCLVLKNGAKKTYSTMKASLANDWFADIAANGTPSA